MHVYGHPDEEKARLAQAWVAAWRAMQGSTERVDRERAERALSALYRERKLARPRCLWVEGPSDGVLAWHLMSRGRTPLRNPYTRGDTGNGSNRTLYQLHDPFGLEPEWMGRAVRRAEQLSPAGSPGGFHGDARYAADGGVLITALRARSMHGARSGDGDVSASDVSMPGEPSQASALARLVLGDRWEQLLRLFGSDLTVDVAVRAVRRAVMGILDVTDSRREAMWALTYPGFDRSIVAMGALQEVLGVAVWRQLDQRARRAAMVERRLELARTGVAFWAFEDMAVLLDRPTRIGLDQRGQLHSADGPAVEYPDGTVVWADHGVQVPERLVLEPASITLKDIDSEVNAEIRRVMIEKFGAERLVREGGAELVHEDETGRLWRRSFQRHNWRRDEPVVMVEVRNATPEPDGSVRRYFLRVPPQMRTAREAVAWTFGLQGTRYAPAVET